MYDNEYYSNDSEMDFESPHASLHDRAPQAFSPDQTSPKRNAHRQHEADTYPGSNKQSKKGAPQSQPKPQSSDGEECETTARGGGCRPPRLGEQVESWPAWKEPPKQYFPEGRARIPILKKELEVMDALRKNLEAAGTPSSDPRIIELNTNEKRIVNTLKDLESDSDDE